MTTANIMRIGMWSRFLEGLRFKIALLLHDKVPVSLQLRHGFGWLPSGVSHSVSALVIVFCCLVMGAIASCPIIALARQEL